MLQEQLLALLAKNATAVMTNVPGPQQPLYLAGARIDSMMFWVPQSGDIGMGVSITVLRREGSLRPGHRSWRFVPIPTASSSVLRPNSRSWCWRR